MTTMGTVEEAQAERGKNRLVSLFQPYRDDKKCQRCRENVYQYEKIGPINGVVFHSTCFRCFDCGQFLTMKTCCSNQIDPDDKEVYCLTHHPRVGAARLDNRALGIKNAIDVQKDFQRLNVKASDVSRPHVDASAMGIKQALNVPRAGNRYNDRVVNNDRAMIDSSALHIQGALHAQALQKRYQKNFDKHHYPAHIVKKRQQIFDAQKKLEEQLRKEEDELYRTFKANRKEERQKLTEEIDQEWETRLKDLTEKFDKEFEKKNKKLKDSDKKAMTMQFESQKKDLENTMTLKREKKKQNMTLRLREKEQNMTSSLVKKQSEQMLSLIAQKKKELQEEIRLELEKQQALELETAEKGTETMQINGKEGTDSRVNGRPDVEALADEEALVEALDTLISPATTDPPKPRAPDLRKRQLYSDVSVFNDIDEMVIKVAQNDQLTYTDLVRQLTETLVSDLEKARAIYRWITVKDLNVMEFDDVVDADTPMGLLRGIKYGTETYHTLFMRLCSYAGLPCVEVKGHSKSVGYEPGMKIQPETFQNTWNAVVVGGDWRLVQCNWGARHLVLNKDKDSERKKKDQIRYQYDEHYFLTDPDEFIQEFWPYEADWQLLENPITLEEFEKLPFVRSIFFHYRMRFEGGKKAALETNDKGGVDITIRIPEELEENLVFYYQLRFAEKEKRQETSYKGASLERFVYQTMVENCVMFSVHVPVMGDYFFEVFANKIQDANKIGLDPNSAMTPFRLKCACKFKICCKQLTGKMHPLPNCASGEWGPKKAQRHFSIRPHYDKPANGEKQENFNAGIVNADNDFELKFKIPRPLQFVAKLRMNQVDDHVLDPFVNLTMNRDILSVYVTLPQAGQYGLDLYARPKESTDTHTLSHACKYLINCSKVLAPVEIPKSAGPSPAMNKDRWGPTAQFEKYGLKNITHKDPKIKVQDINHVSVEIGVPEKVTLTYQFIREPDEDDREYVSMVKENDGKTAKFLVNMPKSGNYMLALYARRDTDEAKTMVNVYNYLIQYNTGHGGHQSNGGNQSNNSNNSPNGSLNNSKEGKSFFKKLTKK